MPRKGGSYISNLHNSSEWQNYIDPTLEIEILNMWQAFGWYKGNVISVFTLKSLLLRLDHTVVMEEMNLILEKEKKKQFVLII